MWGMKHLGSFFFLIFICAGCVNGGHGAGGPPVPAGSPALGRGVKTILFDTSKSPTQMTAQMTAQNISTPTSQAFDGFVVQHMAGSKDNAAQGENFAWQAFDNTRHYSLTDRSADYIGDSFAAIKALPTAVMPERFLRINASPYHPNGFDWLDNNYWNSVIANMRVASQFAYGAGLRGVFLDTELYNSNVYSYSYWASNPNYAGMSYSALATIVENRGRQFIQALNSSYPNLKIFISIGYTSVSQHVSRANSTQDLMMPFLDGMLGGSTPTTKFIDGFEESYWHDNNPNYFSSWASVIKGPNSYNVRFQKYPVQYLQQYQASFALFLDRDRTVDLVDGVYGWCGGTKTNAFYSPARLAYTVQQAALSADNYVWFYSASVHPMVAGGGAPNYGLPLAYIQAISKGRAAGNKLTSPLAQSTDDTPVATTCQP